ncbi:hypothetical protein NL676_006840 [Syzygium grande]|nr:hypothetical protein NL676_006840 [Syzygium grande]
MKILRVGILVATVYLFLALEFAGGYLIDRDVVAIEGEPSSSSSSSSAATYSNDLINEVKKECSITLKSASELRIEDSRAFSIKEELFFVNGDWEQDVGDSPILPFDDHELSSNSSRAPLRLVSFWITDVDRSHRSKKSVFVSGLLTMGITVDGMFLEKPYEGSHQLEIWPGHTRLSISFQGVYSESNQNGGERVLCLLGNTMLPSRESDHANPWQWVKNLNYNQPPLLQDDRILLVLRYPTTFSLTHRLIQGRMTSLNPKSNAKHFDEVHIASQLGKAAHYEFGSEKIVAKSCNPYPYQDGFLNGSIEIYKGTGFCRILEESIGQAFTVVPNWKCNSTDDFCSRLGPFTVDEEIRASDGSFKDVKLYIQDIKCEQTSVQETSSARVAAVFRAVSPLENQYTAERRSGPSNMTLAAEGIWKSSSGQLCMAGCLGTGDSEGSECKSRICLYIPTSFSIKQRSIVLGSFFSLKTDNISFFPLAFEKLVQPTELWNYFKTANPYYSYSKIDLAGVILEKNEPFSFRSVIKKSLLQFPKLEDAESYLVSLSVLSEDLTLHVSAHPDPFPKSRSPRVDLQMEILSLGPLFGRYWSSQNSSSTEDKVPYRTKAVYTERQLLVNVSAQLSFPGKAYSNFSVIFLEGLYDLQVGKMYLVGCRDIRASWKILFESMDLEAGLDCLIEVVISYPPTTDRWLVDPTAKISISSQRNEDDPLHFDSIKLETFPILYRQQREDILSRRGIEGILRVLTLSLAISCILSQLFYIDHNVDSVAYVSLVMLGVQAVGYSLPLITGAEAVFKRAASKSTEVSTYNLERSQWIHVVDYAVKLLVMVSFLLTLRLLQKIDSHPLRKLYYVGITIVRLLPHLYDYTRSPSPNPYFVDEYEFVNPNWDFYSKFGDVAIPLSAVLLAIVVYIQQRWGYEKLSQSLRLGQCKLLPSSSKAYERLPSNPTEAELVSGVNGTSRHDKENDDED